MYHHGILLLEEENGDVRELFNHARTAAYMASSTALGCATVSNILDDGGCAAYPWMPPGTGGVTDEEPDVVAALQGWSGYWDPEVDAGYGPTNLGTAGTALDGTNEGLVRVVGPAIWFPVNNVSTTYSSILTMTASTFGLDGNADLYSEFTIGPLLSIASTDNTVFSNRSTEACILWIRFSTTGQLALSRGNYNGTILTTINSVTAVPLVFAKETMWRVWVPLNDMPVAHYSLDGGVTWTDVGAFTDVFSGAALGHTTASIGGEVAAAGRSLKGYLRTFKLTGGTTNLEVNASDITNTGATSFVCATGQTVTVGRAATSHVLMVVPDGEALYINPGETVTTNRIVFPSTTEFDLSDNWGFFSIPGTTGGLTTPDAAALDIVGDLEIVARCRSIDWTDPAVQTIVGKRTTAPQQAYEFRITTTGTPSLVWSADGTATNVLDSTAPVPWADGVGGWLKMTFDVSLATARFYYAADAEDEPSSWTALGTAVVGTAPTSIAATTAILGIGCGTTGATAFYGDMKAVIIRNGIGGSVVFRTGGPDIPTTPVSTYVATSGQTVTINAVVGLVPRTGDDAVFLWQGTLGNAPVAPPQTLLGNATAATGLYFQSNVSNTVSATLYDGTTTVSTTTLSMTTRKFSDVVIMAIVDRTAQLLKMNVYDSVGLVSSLTASITAVRSVDAAAASLLQQVPGSARLAAFNKGCRIAPSDSAAAALAASLYEAEDTANTPPPGWTQQTYLSPEADGAPWYNPAYPESAQALGFWIAEWTGLDSGHVKRASTPVGAYRGGSVLGPASNSGRVMGFEVILLGESEQALEYLFRWLEATIESVCSTCSTDTVLFRRFCPNDEPAAVADGLTEMRGVGMLEGPTWGSPPVETAGCFIRRVNFTLEATDPCMYSQCTSEPIDQSAIWNNCFLTANIISSRTECRPSCTEMSSDCRTVFNFTVDTVAASAARVVLTPPNSAIGGGTTLSGSIPVRIRTYADPLGLSAGQICGAPLLAELYVTSLPPDTELEYDMAGRQVRYRPAGAASWYNGFSYVAPNTVGVPRFPSLGCGDYTVIVEPSDFCMTRLPSPTTPLASGQVDFVWSQGERILIGGTFATFNDVTVNNITAITRGGMLAPAFNLGASLGTNGTVSTIGTQTDGKVLIGGTFTTVRGVTQNRIARLNVDGTLDTTFNTGGTIGVSGPVVDLQVQPDGKILITGSFTTARGTTQNGIARLTTTGALDTGFNTGGTVGLSTADGRAIYLQSDNKILVGGLFASARGTTVNNIARLNVNGTIDTTFNTGGTIGVNGAVTDMAIQPNDRIILVGDFTTARGTTMNRLARLTGDGTLDLTYNPGATPGVSAIANFVDLQPDGNVVVGGTFLTARGVTVNRIARFRVDGTLDTTFNVGGTVGADSTVTAVEALPDGRLMIGGAFLNVRGVARNRVAVLHPDGSLDLNFPRSQLFTAGLGAPTPELWLQERMGCA